MKYPKYLFLDFDGVLNSRPWLTGPECAASRKRGETMAPRARLAQQQFAMLDSACVVLLNRIVDETCTKIVVSSSWRSHVRGAGGSKSDLAACLSRRGFKYASLRVVGITPDLCRQTESGIYVSATRWDEISAYMKEHSCENFCILDDDAMADAPQDHFVRTSFDTGLTRSDVERVIAILNGDPQ